MTVPAQCAQTQQRCLCADIVVLLVLQEDAHAVDLDIDGQHTALFGVFDGHAGKEVAAYCARHIVSACAAE